MIRTQIQLPQATYEKLRRTAQRQGRSMAACIRDGVDAYLLRAAASADDLEDVAGRFAPDAATGVKDHDKWWGDAAVKTRPGRKTPRP